MPGVASVTTVGIPASGQPTCACTHAIDASNFYINEVSPTALSRVVKLVAGRMPNQSSPRRGAGLLQPPTGQRRAYRVGDPRPVVCIVTGARLCSGANASPSGPTVALHVVGIEAAELEFPSGQAPEYDLFTTQAFARAENQRIVVAAVYLVRLRHGTADLPRFAAAANALHLVYVSNQDTAAAAVAASIHPQAVGWWVLAALAALAGLAVIGQALGRQSVVESEEYPTLSALGLPRRQLVVLGTARNLAVALAGGAGAVVVAFALSPLTPVGEARLAEPSTGLAFDPLVLLLGALATVVVVLALGIWPAVRASRVRIGTTGCQTPPVIGRGPPGRHRCAPECGDRGPSRPGTGTRCRLGPGRYRPIRHGVSGHGPVRDGRLRRQPVAPDGHSGALRQRLPADVLELGGGAGNSTSELAGLEHDPAITGIMLVARDEVSINGVSVLAIAGKAVRGPLLLSVVSGRLPAGDGEIALGTTTLHQVGAHVGSVVVSPCKVPTAAHEPPPFASSGPRRSPATLGSEDWVPGRRSRSPVYLNAVCPPGPTQSRCQSASAANQNFAVLARVVSGPKGQADIAHYISQGRCARGRPSLPRW